jgi:hypothetical protein
MQSDDAGGSSGKQSRSGGSVGHREAESIGGGTGCREAESGAALATAMAEERVMTMLR